MSKKSFGTRAAALCLSLPLLVTMSACAPPTSAKVATDSVSVTHDENSRVPEGAAWTQHYFPSSDGSDVELHADVLLPEGLAEGETVPVVLSVGAYFGHSGEVVRGDYEHTGPSGRFADLIEGADLFDQGYALVMVDLRGFGGSTGCLDFMGPGEQADVKAAIDWATAQPWSTGAVGMYGKSYDAITGLVGNNLDHDALKAVVAQEPLWDLHQNMRSNGVPRSPIVDTSRSYNDAAMLPPMADDTKRYRENAEFEASNPLCTAVNSLEYRTADPQAAFWQDRDLVEQAKGTDTPLFVTQGFLEYITETHGMQEYLANHEGPQRAWLGQWDHKRGNDVDGEGRLAMGREGWFDETMAFFDKYLKNVEPTVDYPAFAVQDSRGDWRAEEAWPVVDATASLIIGGGTYVDDGAEGDPAIDTGNSFLQWSEPIAEDTRVTGTPRVSITASGYGNVMIKLYDVAPDGTAVMFDDNVSMLQGSETIVDLKATDWTLAAGHQLAIEIGTIRTGPFSNWIDTPSYQSIEVSGARLDLSLDNPTDDSAIDGEPALFVEDYLALSTVDLAVQPGTFTVPPAQE